MLRLARSCLSAGGGTEGVLAAALPCRAIVTSATCNHAEPALNDQATPATSSPAHELGAIRTDWTCVSTFVSFASLSLNRFCLCCTKRCAKRHCWYPNDYVLPVCWCSREDVHQVYNSPLLELVFRAATVHRMYNDPRMVSPTLLASRSAFLFSCTPNGSTGAICDAWHQRAFICLCRFRGARC